jgi:hypothetical protein
VPTLQMICLANSYKLGGRCVAGLRADGKGWIRPVSETASGTLNAKQYTCEGDVVAQPMDLIEIDVGDGRPLKYQRENVALAGRRWRLLERPASVAYATIVRAAIVKAGPLLGGSGDRRHLDDFPDDKYANSLALVAPVEIEWEKATNYRNKPQVRCHFKVGTYEYNLVVTDLAWIPRFDNLTYGTHRSAEIGLRAGQRVLLCTSMAEPIAATGNCFRLVAAVITPSLGWQRALFA